jgi:hypothetical protein
MIHHNKFSLILLAVLLLTNSCEKPNTAADIHSYRIIDTKTEGIIDRSDSTILLNFPSGFNSAEDLTAEFSISEGAVAIIESELQVSGETSNNYEKPFTLQVIAEDEFNESNWQVIGINNNYTFDWGLGGFLKESFSLERDYEWYLDQGDTEKYKYDNCGPTSTVMAAKWSNRNFSQTPVDARAAYRSDGGWWYTDDISQYLSDYDIPHTITELGNNKSETEELIKLGLDSAFLVLLCLDMYYISDNNISEERVDKFYYTRASEWGHFILVKGYRVVDGNLFFEVYDPYSFGEKYYDGSLKGKNRYYRSKDIYSATRIWWNYAFYISEKNSNISLPPMIKSGIIHKWGR